MATTTERVQYLLELRDKFSRQMNTADKATNRADESAKRLAGTLKSLVPLFSAGAAIAGIKKTVELYEAEEQALAQVKQGLIATNGAVGRTFQQLTAQADALQKKTVFGNEAILAGVTAQLQTFTNVSGTSFDRAQKAVLDLTARLDGPRAGMEALRGKAIQVGKALNDPVAGMTALSRSGVTFSQAQKDMIKQLVKTNQTAEAQNIILSELERQYGGSAEAAANTATGQLIQFENRMGDIGEKIGAFLIPHLLELAKKFESLVEFVQKNATTFEKYGKIAIRVGAALVAYRVTLVAIRKATLLYQAAQKAAIITNILFTKGLKKARVAMRLFNVTAKANPIGLIVAGLTLLVPLLIKAFSSTKKLNATMRAANAINKKATEIYADQASRVKVLQTTLEAGNLTQKQRGEIIREINKDYGQYLDKLLTEKSTDEEIAAALERVNNALLRKARIQAGKDILAENAKEQIRLERLLRDEQALTEKATEGFLDKAAATAAYISGGRERYIKARVEEEREAAQEALKNLEEENRAIVKLTNTEIQSQKKIKRASESGTTETSGKTVGLDKETKRKLETGIRAGAPKIVNINIGSLIESFNIETKQFKEAPIRVKEEVTKVILDALNDASLLQR